MFHAFTRRQHKCSGILEICWMNIELWTPIRCQCQRNTQNGGRRKNSDLEQRSNWKPDISIPTLHNIEESKAQTKHCMTTANPHTLPIHLNKVCAYICRNNHHTSANTQRCMAVTKLIPVVLLQRVGWECVPRNVKQTIQMGTHAGNLLNDCLIIDSTRRKCKCHKTKRQYQKQLSSRTTIEFQASSINSCNAQH